MKHQILLTGLLLGFLSACDNKTSPVTIQHLRCEYLENPEGIDVKQPRLSWQLESDERGQLQTAYRILVASDSSRLVNNKADVWDSGNISSEVTAFIPFGGQTLQPGKKYFWKIKSWDVHNHETSWSAIASWSMGLLDSTGWKAKWIGIAPTAVPMDSQYNIHAGYQSAIATRADVTKSVTVDLGTEQRFHSVKLYPALFGKNLQPHLFPTAFTVIAASDKDFTRPQILADYSKTGYTHGSLQPLEVSFPAVSARYIKVTVNKLAAIDKEQYAFALGELAVLNSENQNVALGAVVDADDVYEGYKQFSTEKWWPALLTDGFLHPNRQHTAKSIPVPASPLLRKEFITKKPIQRATLYATSLGLYEAYINGKKVGDHVLAPEWTDYHSRVQYQTYDVTKLVKEGANAIGAMLADGWYAGVIFSHPERGSYGLDRKLLAQLQIEYADGDTDIIATDSSWKTKQTGPITAASIFDGETYNASAAEKDWKEPGLDVTQWTPATEYPQVKVAISAQMNEPIKVIQEIKPIKIIPQKNGAYIFDLGQNIAGWVQLNLPYNPHNKIVLRHGEVLDTKGALYTDNLRGATQMDTYIPGMETNIQYEPRFTYHGFRFVEITGLTQAPDLNTVTAKVVASSAPVAGSFECSSKELNKLWENILWTQKGNMHAVPTDCPQRDERAGWMGDAQVFSNNAIFNMDMGAFFTKWIRDIRDSQTKEGRFPDYAPQVGTWANFYNSPGWGDAGVIVPWRLYEHYGDVAVLAAQYEPMKRFIVSVLKYNKDLLWKNERGNMYGDWLNGNTIIEAGYPKEGGKVPDDVYSTAFFYYSTNIVAKTAHLLNKTADAARYDSLAAAIKTAFIKAYISSDGIIEGNTQAGYALALDFGLVPENLKTKAAAHMAEAVKVYDFRISTGIQTTIRLMNQLTRFGYSDIAYKLIESRRFPSWLYSIDQGATTIWERWDGYVQGRGFQNAGMNSFNHYAIGAVGEWMYRSILGINNDPAAPGYKHFFIEPVPGGSITYAKGTYNSIAGKIAVSWISAENEYSLDVTVPVNTSATIVIPSGKTITENGMDIKSVKGIEVLDRENNKTRIKVQSGKYSFKST